MVVLMLFVCGVSLPALSGVRIMRMGWVVSTIGSAFATPKPRPRDSSVANASQSVHPIDHLDAHITKALLGFQLLLDSRQLDRRSFASIQRQQISSSNAKPNNLPIQYPRTEKTQDPLHLTIAQ